MMYDAVVVGAGLAGAVSANILANAGFKVLIIEKSKHIAGQCFDYKDDSGITIHKYGPHIFHTKSKSVWDYVCLFSDFRAYQHKVLSFVNGQYLQFPINRDTINAIFGEQLPQDKVGDFLKKQIENSQFNVPSQSFRDAVVCQVGEELYKLFFENYTIKQWGCDPAELSATLAGRIPVRYNNDDRYFDDKYQGLPTKGYTGMVRNMLEHPNIHILSGCDYFELKKDLQAKLTVYTGMLDEYFAYKYGKLQYRSVKIELKTYDTDNFQPASVVNYPNDYDWTRITEFKKLTGEISDKTTVCREYPSENGLPFYTVPTDENQMKRELYMQDVEILEQKKNILFIGRLAEYKYYNMDNVVEVAMKRINEWVGSITNIETVK